MAKAGAGRRPLHGDHEALKQALRTVYAEQGVIPALAGLAAVWGFASKSSAARVVAVLLEEGFLQAAPGRRLRPGKNFSPPAEDRDVVDEAVQRWASGYGNAPYHAYDIASRLQGVARKIDQGSERAAARMGVTAGEIQVLDALYRLGPPFTSSPTALKRQFILSLAGVGKRLAGLERKRLIDRLVDERDGRGLLVRLNDAGRALLERAVAQDNQEPHIAWVWELLPEEVAELSRLLRKAQRIIEKKLSLS
jgi:DNA-binding MarR family transcriptional regulator